MEMRTRSTCTVNVFEMTKFDDVSSSGVSKDEINVPRYQRAEGDFVADDPAHST